MGQRANYILVEQNKASMYYTHWGATAIPEMLLAGPERSWAYIQHATPCTELLNDIWAEGGVFMDRDSSRLLFWGGEGIRYTPYLRRFFLPALRLLWPRWTVEWALYGVADLADALHIDRSLVLANNFADKFADYFEEGFDPDKAVSDEDLLLESEYETTLLTVKWKDETVSDYRMAYLPGSILSRGPHLLDVLSRKKPDSLPHERDEDFDGGAFFDLTTQNIWVWKRSTLDPRYLTAISQVWAGWHIAGHVEGIVQQVILSGRDSSGIIIPQEEAITKLVQELTVEGPRMPSLNNLMAAVTTEVPEGTQAQVAPDFFTVPGQIISVEERRHVLQQLFHTPSDRSDP